MDGTLWNASAASADGWNQGLSSLGLEERLSPSDLERVAGHPFDDCIRILLPGLAERHPLLKERLEQGEIEAVKAQGGRFYAGVFEGITELAESHPLFLVSNCQSWYLEVFLGRFEPAHLLSGFDCHGLSGLSKGRMLARMAHRHALTDPVYIGDTAGDEASAGAADMAFVHAAYGFGRPEGQPPAFGSFPELVGHFMGRGVSS